MTVLEEARSELFHSRFNPVMKFGIVLFALHAGVDYLTFNDWTAVLIRLGTTVIALLALSLVFTTWGKRHRVGIATLAFFICYTGFLTIVCHEKAFGSVYEDALDLFLPAYCVLLPVKTRVALLAGIGMAIMSITNEVAFNQNLDPVDLAVPVLGYAVVIALFVYARHVTNQHWEAEFKARGELAHTLQELRLTQGRLVQSERMAAIGRLTGEVAHELNNPLTLISVNLSTIERDAAARPETTEEFLRSMNESIILVQQGVQQATNVVRNLRQLGGVLRKESELADINAILGTAVSLIAGRAQRSGITIHQKYELLPKTWCNPQSLSQVFINVLQNACEAIKNKGNIWVATKSGENEITITICDDGPGVLEAVLAHVFEPYYTTKEGSTGIGLAICRRIIEEHQGNIALANGQSGAKVTITLPIRSL